jgi:hypothetical protein
MAHRLGCTYRALCVWRRRTGVNSTHGLHMSNVLRARAILYIKEDSIYYYYFLFRKQSSVIGNRMLNPNFESYFPVIVLGASFKKKIR